MKEIKNIYGESLASFFNKAYGERGAEIHNIATLLANYFYFNKSQYHKDDTSYLAVTKTFNRGMGRGLLIKFYASTNEFWINMALANKRDIERLNKMVADNDIKYPIIQMQYDLWNRQWMPYTTKKTA